MPRPAKYYGLLALKIVALTIVLMLASSVGSRLLPSAGDGGAVEAPSSGFFSLIFAVMLAQVVALAYPLLRSLWTGWTAVAALALLHFATVTGMNQIETVVYLGDDMPAGMVRGLFLMGLVVAAIFAPVAVFTLGRWRTPFTPPAKRATLNGWPWKIPAAGALYVLLYYLFGYYVAWQNPEVRAFYNGTDPGSFIAQMAGIVRDTPWMLPLQFLRGMLWVILGIVVVRMMNGPWRHFSLAIALLFAVPCLYLLFPNPLMPEAVRMSHLVETLPYQFAFGGFLGWLFRTEQAETVTL